jgi:hypothetical protein
LYDWLPLPDDVEYFCASNPPAASAATTTMAAIALPDSFI